MAREGIPEAGGSRMAMRVAVAAIAIAAVALLLAAIPLPLHRSHLPSNTDHGAFTRHGYIADEGDLPLGVVGKGSRPTDDGYTGDFQSAWYDYSSRARVMVCGYPRGKNLELVAEALQKDGSLVRTTYLGPDPHEHWISWDPKLPDSTVRFRLLGSDQSRAWGGWFGVSAPFEQPLLPPLRDLPGNIALFVALALCGILLSSMTLGFAGAAGAGFGEMGVAVGLILTCLCAYVSFWAYFLAPWLGWVASFGSVSLGVYCLARSVSRPSENRIPVLALCGLSVAVGLGFAAVGLLYKQGVFSEVIAVRFQRDLGSDNCIPRLFADKLFAGLSPKHLIEDWLSSDRPPLQAGFVLLLRPILLALGSDSDTGASACGLLFNLMWVPAIWLTLRRLGCSKPMAFAAVAAAAFTGIFLFHTDFTWPKLGASALTLFAFLFWFGADPSWPVRRRYLFAGLSAGLGWLAHGGVSFSLVALVPFVLVSLGKGPPQAWRLWAFSAVAFCVLAFGWIAYGKFYEPPANRLFKMHLAGVVDAGDSRTFLAALKDQYAKVGFAGAWDARMSNWRLQWGGHWAEAFTFRLPKDFIDGRWDESEMTLRSFGWWIVAFPALAWVLVRRKTPLGRLAFVWWLLGAALAIDLLFQPMQATVHQGTMLTQLVGFALLFYAAIAVSRWLFAAIFLLQLVSFLKLWLQPTPDAVAPLMTSSAVVAGGCAFLLLALTAYGLNAKEPPVAVSKAD